MMTDQPVSPTDDLDFEEALEEVPATGRLATPLSLNDILDGKISDFSIRTDDDDQCLGELDTDVTKVFAYDELEEVGMPENLECEDSDEDDEPINIGLPFARFRRRMTRVTEDGKIIKKIETPGHGPTLPADKKLIVYVHYAAFLEMAEYPFDSTRLRYKRPAKLFLGSGEVLIGFEMALRSMAIGEKSKFIIHPDLAFGEAGCPPRVPPNSFLLYNIELIDSCEDVERIPTIDEDNPAKFEDVLKKSMQLRNMAKKKIDLEKNVRAAISLYKRGLRCMLPVHYDTNEQETLRREEVLKLYTNLAVCYLQTNQPKQTCNAFNDATKECGKLVYTNVKLNYTSAKALRMLSSFDEALKRLQRANKLKPRDKAICAEIETLEKAKKSAVLAEKSMSQKMFGFEPELTADNEKEEQVYGQVSREFINELKDIIDKFLVQDVEESTKLDFSYTMDEKSFIINYCKKRKLVLKILDSGVIIIKKPAF